MAHVSRSAAGAFAALGVIVGLAIGVAGVWLAYRFSEVACTLLRGSLAEWVGAIGTAGALLWAIWLATSESRRRSFEAQQEGLLLMALVLPEILAMRPILADIAIRLERMSSDKSNSILQPDLRAIGDQIARISIPRLPTDIHGLAAFNWHMGRALAVLLSNLHRLNKHAAWLSTIRAPRPHDDLVADLEEIRRLNSEAIEVASTAADFMRSQIQSIP